MLRLMDELDEVLVVDDQRGSPIYTRDLAAALSTIISVDSLAYGMYHYTNEGEATWLHSARLDHATVAFFIQRFLPLDPPFPRPLNTQRYSLLAGRGAPRHFVGGRTRQASAERVYGPLWGHIFLSPSPYCVFH